MNFDWADIMGLIGSVLCVAALGYANTAVNFDKVRFNLANLIGAAFLVTSLWVHFNLAAFLLEVVWGLIALWGLIKAWRAKGREA